MTEVCGKISQKLTDTSIELRSKSVASGQACATQTILSSFTAFYQVRTMLSDKLGRAGCVEDDNNPFYPSYGCFCGLRIRGPEPVDCFDRACERHWECINEGVNDMGCSEFELQAWPYIYHMVDGEVR